MELTPFTFTIMRVLYPLPSKNLTRDRPLQILALGLSRSGTESLQQALIQLGYSDCHHGYRFIMDSSETLPWIHLALTKQRRKLTASDFDTVLGDCAAVTDTPGYCFANELLDAYPDAKVILNYREDAEAWFESVEKTINTEIQLTWFGWVQTFFESYLFWTHHVAHGMFFSSQFGGDFKKNGRRWREEHYRDLEERLGREERLYLKWKVQDGWEPLCQYLDKDVPAGPFPNGNAPAAFQARIIKGYAACKESANRHMLIAGGILAAVGIALTQRSVWHRLITV